MGGTVEYGYRWPLPLGCGTPSRRALLSPWSSRSLRPIRTTEFNGKRKSSDIERNGCSRVISTTPRVVT
jgi:hypothetical protein